MGSNHSPETRKKISDSNTLDKNPKYKQIIISVFHPEHGVFKGNRIELIKLFPHLTLSGLLYLHKGVNKFHHGWAIMTD